VNTINLNEFTEAMKLTALQAGSIALELRPHIQNIGKQADVPEGSEQDNRAKAAREAKTIVDLAIQELFLTVISKQFPQIKIVIAEEETRSLKLFQGGANERFRFILDSLDGTLEYLNNGNKFGILTGLIDYNRFVAAVLYYPAQGWLYWAVNGDSAYLEHKRTVKKLSSIAIHPTPPIIEVNSRVVPEAREKLQKQGFEVRVVPDAATAILRVAEGKSMAYACHTRNLHDIGMATFIAELAGVMACNWHGEELLYPYTKPTRIPCLLVTSDRIGEMVEVLQGF